MPALDGTGPLGPGRGQRRGLGRRVQTTRTKYCTCPNCGEKVPCKRGIPCTEKKCPKCSSEMRGPNC